MKEKVLSCLLLILLFLTGCGAEKPSEAAPTKSPAELLMEAAGGTLDEEVSEVEVDTTIVWTEINCNDGTYAYMLGGDADLTALPIESDAPALYQTWKERVKDTMVLQKNHLDGTVIEEYIIPTLRDEEGIQIFCFGENSVFLVRNHYEFVETEEFTGQRICGMELERWDDGGNCLFTIPFEELFGADSEFVPYDIALIDHQLLLVGDGFLYWLDEKGSILHTTPLESGAWYFRYDRDGNIYLYDVDTGALRDLDCGDRRVGQVLLDTAFLEGVYPGSGPYDFFLCDDTLRGVDMDNHTITEFMTLEDCGLTDMVNNVLYLSDGEFVLGLNSIFSSEAQYQILRRVSPEEIPEKTVITLAYGMGQEMASQGFTWKDTSGGSFQMEIAEFNGRSRDYTVEVVEFTDVNDLNMKIAAGEIPDIICWSNNLMDATAIRSYQRNGYLADLLHLMETDPEVDPDDLLPSIREAYTASDGSIYLLPTDLFCFSLKAHSRFVGTEPGWSYQDLYEIAQNLPEEAIVTNWTGDWLMRMLLQYTLGNFVDIETGQTHFDGEEFQALMYTARDCMPEEAQLQDLPESYYTIEGLVTGEMLFQMEVWVGGASYAAEYMPENEQAGVTLIGYPGAGGNGTIIDPGLTFSISAFSDCPEGAWSFLRNYFTYDFQYLTGGHMTFPVMESALLDSEEARRQSTYDCSDEQYRAGIDIVMEAEVPTLEDSTILNIILEEAAPFLAGEKSFEDVIALMENRVSIYLSEQS